MALPSHDSLIIWMVYSFWAWKIASYLYCSYSVSSAVTPSSAGPWFQNAVMFTFLSLTALMNMLPLHNYPRLSLSHTVLSIPSQIHSIYFANKYIGGTIGSTRVNIFIYVISAFSIIETVYSMVVDYQKISYD